MAEEDWVEGSDDVSVGKEESKLDYYLRFHYLIMEIIRQVWSTLIWPVRTNRKKRHGLRHWRRGKLMRGVTSHRRRIPPPSLQDRWGLHMYQ